jgi:Putative amidase domain
LSSYSLDISKKYLPTSHKPSMLLALFIAIAMTLFSQGASAFASTGSQETPTDVVTASYQAMDAAMNAGNSVSHPMAATLAPSTLLNSASARVTTSSSGSALYTYDQTRINSFRTWAASHTNDYSAVNVWSTFQTKSSSVQGTVAQVTGTESLHIDATVQDNGQPHVFSPEKAVGMAAIKNTSSYIDVGQTNHALALIDHTVSLHLVNQHWQIESDQYWDPLVQRLQSDHKTLFQAMAPKTQSNTHTNPNISVTPLTTYSYTYYRSSAIAYADRWWNGCNPSSNYNCYESQGVDCANFVSQAIYDATGGNIPGDDYWYSIAGVGTSLDFVNAPGLYSYMISSPDGSAYNIASNHQAETTNYNTAKSNDLIYEYPGDVIFYDWAPANGNKNHVTISVAADANGYTYVDSHTANEYHFYWDMGAGAGSGTGFFFVELKNSGSSVYHQ